MVEVLANVPVDAEAEREEVGVEHPTEMLRIGGRSINFRRL
jgi:hypothetical protein